MTEFNALDSGTATIKKTQLLLKTSKREFHVYLVAFNSFNTLKPLIIYYINIIFFIKTLFETYVLSHS